MQKTGYNSKSFGNLEWLEAIDDRQHSTGNKQEPEGAYASPNCGNIQHDTQRVFGFSRA